LIKEGALNCGYMKFLKGAKTLFPQETQVHIDGVGTIGAG
jgi:hypothetical protein